MKSKDNKIIDKVQEIRRKNNVCWMNILRLAFEAQPQRAKKIMQQINKNDAKVTMLMSRLGDDE